MFKIFKLTWMGAFFLLATGTATLAQAQEDYVRACEMFGVGYFFIPQTDTCVHASTGGTLEATEYGIRASETRLADRVGDAETNIRELNHFAAISTALQDPDLISDETFGLKLNWGTANGANAVGLTGAAVIVRSLFSQGGRLAISGGIGFTDREVGGRAGAQITW